MTVRPRQSTISRKERYYMSQDLLPLIYGSLVRDYVKVKSHFYCTDIGSCPRKVVMSFYDKDFKTERASAAARMMFLKAENDHSANAGILDKASNSVAVLKREMRITEGLPPMWSGRIDCIVLDVRQQIAKLAVIDWKGTRSLTWTSDLPKSSHVAQIRCYLMALNKMNYKMTEGKLIYQDRSGSTEGLEFWVQEDNLSVLNEMVKYEKSLSYTIGRDIATFDGVTTGMLYEKPGYLERLPDRLPREIKKTGNEFFMVPNWQCGYCAYKEHACKPNMRKTKVAELIPDPDGPTLNPILVSMRKGFEKYKSMVDEIYSPDLL